MGLSTSKIYHPRQETRNIDGSIVFESVIDTDSDQYEEGKLIKFLKLLIFEHQQQ